MSIPKILYKYRSWQEDNNISDEKKFQKRLLTECEFYISSPSQFNDPFDLAIPKRYDLMSRDQIFRRTLFTYGQNKPEKTFKEIYNLALQKTNELVKKSDYEDSLKGSIEHFSENHGVYSLSERPDNIISWAFYANNHSGYCVGLDTGKLLNYIESELTKSVGFYKVNYTSELPEIIPDIDLHIFIDNVRKRLATKYINWSFENEWRIITPNYSKKASVISTDIFKEVYIGCNAKDSVKNEITGLVKNGYLGDIRLFQLEPSKINFELLVKEIK
ncbi:MAG: DUF2971 domain-containing protein [Nanoarchaeota archaeon]